MIKWHSLSAKEKNRLVYTRIIEDEHDEIPAYTESMDAAWHVLKRMEESCIMVFFAGHEAFASDLFLAAISPGEYAFEMHGRAAVYVTLKDIAALTPMRICEMALKILCNDIDFEESEDSQ